jgi:hypothetical protein
MESEMKSDIGNEEKIIEGFSFRSVDQVIFLFVNKDPLSATDLHPSCR